MHDSESTLPVFGKRFRSSNMTPASPMLFICLYVEVASMGEALEQAGLLNSILLPVGVCSGCEVKPYWKIAEYFGIELRIRAAEPDTAFEQATQLLTASWVDATQIPGTCDVIWDYRMHGPFALPLARWCNLQFE